MLKKNRFSSKGYNLFKIGIFLFLGLFMTASYCTAATVINFANTSGYGLSSDRVMVENIRVDNEIVNPFDPSHPQIVSSYYNVPFVFDYSNYHLVPDLNGAVVVDGGGGGGSTCSGTVNVYVTNAYNGDPISGAHVTGGSGSADSDANGLADFVVTASGTVQIEANATGYTSSSRTATIDCSSATSIGIALSPTSGEGALNAGEARIVLTWGANPRDLDSHLTGPNSSNNGNIDGDDDNRFHVYYSHKTEDVAVLDVDDTSSYGPETVTISPPDFSSTLRSGLYRYSVHHYSGSSDISNSNASVSLTIGGTTRNYTPPAGSPGDDAVWTVFELYVDGFGNATVYDINTFTADVSAGSVRTTTTGYGSVETGVDFARLPAK